MSVKKFLFGVVSLITSCINPEKGVQCDALVVYKGHPSVEIIKKSISHQPTYINNPRTRRVSLGIQQPNTQQPNTQQPNIWQLINRDSVNLLELQELQNSGVIKKGRILQAKDNKKMLLTKKSLEHLTLNHGHDLGVRDFLPRNPNERKTPYQSKYLKTNHTNPENLLHVSNTIETIINSVDTEIFENIKIRGTLGHGYVTRKNYGSNSSLYRGMFIGVHTEGEFSGQLMKCQPMSLKDLKKLRLNNTIQ